MRQLFYVLQRKYFSAFVKINNFRIELRILQTILFLLSFCLLYSVHLEDNNTSNKDSVSSYLLLSFNINDAICYCLKNSNCCETRKKYVRTFQIKEYENMYIQRQQRTYEGMNWRCNEAMQFPFIYNNSSAKCHKHFTGTNA